MTPPPVVALLVTGEEILQGRVQERNAGYLARFLAGRGFPPARVVVVGDGLLAIRDALREMLAAGADLVVVSGGLGPTHDDRTMEAVAAAVGRPLVLNPRALEMVVRGRAGIRAIERIDPAARRIVEEKQAMLPENADVIPPAGTAPGAVVARDGAMVVVLPGPPWELEEMWRRAAAEVAPLAALLERPAAGDRRLLRLYGVVESEVALQVARLPEDVRQRVELGICARSAEIEVAARGDADAVRAVEDALGAAFGPRLYSRDGTTALEQAAGLLLDRGETLALAESCTGGLLGALLTSAAGSSAWFAGGVVAYDNAVKQRLLGVEAATIARHGAVSAECAREMAEGARRVVGAHWAVSVTGVAGPGGGTADKPVGRVYLGVTGPDGLTDTHDRQFRGDRERVRERAAATAVHLLRIALRRRTRDT